MIDVSIVVPVYNAKSLLKIIDPMHLPAYLQTEIILVDDAGDHADSYASELAFLPPNVFYFRMDTNIGQDKATAFGISKATGKYIVTIDDDLEFPPSEIIKLYDAITATSIGIAYGLPAKPKKSLFRVVTRKFYYGLVNMLGYPVFSSFRILRSNLVPLISGAYSAKNFCLDKLLLQHNKTPLLITVDYHPKEITRYSKYKLFKKFLIFFLYTPS